METNGGVPLNCKLEFLEIKVMSMNFLGYKLYYVWERILKIKHKIEMEPPGT